MTDLSDLRVLTLTQPPATLLADPELPKTIIDRPKPWPSTIPLPAWVLIGAAAKRPEPWSKVGDYRIVPVNHRRGWYLTRQMDGAEIGQRPLWLGAVIGAAHVTECLPIRCGSYAIQAKDEGTRGLWLTPIRRPGGSHRLLLDENISGNDPDELTDLSAELPYGDFTPGRFGYLTDRTVLFPEPIRWKGAQGFQRATPALIEQVTPWLT